MEKKDRLIMIVRHGDYIGNGDRTSPLSNLGVEQMKKVRDLFRDHLLSLYGENVYEMEKLTFSFSVSARAMQSAMMLYNGGDIIATDLFLTERHEIAEPGKIVSMVLTRLDQWKSSIAVIVAHGVMPAVFAEKAANNGIGTTKFKQLRSPGKGEGYIINVETGEVLCISPDGISELEKPKPPAAETKKVTVAPPTIVMSPEVKASKPCTPTYWENNDDDIPF